MASSIDFVQYIVDQCSKAGDIVAKKMFGDYGIYCDGKIFGLICDDKLRSNRKFNGLLIIFNEDGVCSNRYSNFLIVTIITYILDGSINGLFKW